MSRLQHIVLGNVLFGLLLCLVQAGPACLITDEECHERRMHPVVQADHTKTKDATLRMVANGENRNEYWRNKGKEFVREKLNTKRNNNKAKNIIMFLGDGMGFTTTAAARAALSGEEEFLSFEKFPYTGFSKTYSVDKIVTDSAGSGTGYLCGVKTYSGTLGLNAGLARATCQDMENHVGKVDSIAKWALNAGKSAGIVTTTRITHASPAAAYSHITERDWEYNSVVEDDCGANSGVRDIAYQLIHGDVGSKLQVIFGGGRRNFIDKNINSKGYRTDGKNLIDEFKALNENNVYLSNRDELLNVNLNTSNRLLGLFANSHLEYNLRRTASDNQPTLTEMTQKAIEKLSQNTEGYFLFVEGGRIDHAHHDNYARLALDETIQFSEAIQAAVNLTNQEDTLIVVTADHSHAFSYAGYAQRGDDIFSTTGDIADDGKQYMTLSYANGPGFENFYDKSKEERRDPTQVDVSKVDTRFPSTYYLSSETHGGEDVPVFAFGPHSHIFTGVFDQNVIPHAMAYAACVGEGLKAC